MKRQIDRRDAMKTCVAAATGFWIGAQRQPRAEAAAERLNIACIGIGGQGAVNLGPCLGQNVVALCDVDEVRAGKNFERAPRARRYTDFRKMFDDMEKQIDAVVISTPDHTHFHPAYWALERGKHVYLEKPMAHNIAQVRRLTELARAKKLATQLGVQRHTIPNVARVVELIRAKVIGAVSEVHAWISSARGMPADPERYPTVPRTMQWDLWLGPAEEARYSPDIAPYKWRFWWDYGTGETGNWGCHILDIPYWALELKYPMRVSAAEPKPHAKKTPTTMTTRFEFPATQDRGPITLHWHQHGSPPVLKEKGIEPKGMNTVFIGTKGILACGFEQRRLYPVEQFKDFTAPAPTIRPSPGFHREWQDACKGGAPASCNFDYTGPMTETVLLGNVAYRAGGQPFTWDAAQLTAIGNNGVAQFLREPVRKGWEI